MSPPALGLARAAQDLVGAPFRLHGRDPATGLDCVGLLAVALARAGLAVDLPNGYALRSRQVPDLSRLARANGFSAVQGTGALPGDVVIAAPSPCQVHLAVGALAGGFVHAHAGLGRVVLSPAPLPWPVASTWRLLASH